MKTSKRIISMLLAISIILAASVISSAADTYEPKKNLLGKEIVANVYILYSTANTFFPHIWIYVENISNKSLTIGHYTLPKGEAVSMGCWSDRGDGNGVHYNLERYYCNEDTYFNNVYLKTTATESQLKAASRCCSAFNFWTWSFNCTLFATMFWNCCSVKILPYLFFPALDGALMRLYGAKHVDFEISKLNNPKKVYKHTRDGLRVCCAETLVTTVGV